MNRGKRIGMIKQRKAILDVVKLHSSSEEIHSDRPKPEFISFCDLHATGLEEEVARILGT